MSKLLKTNYRVDHQVESFFTGSHIQFDKEGEHFYCAHGSVVNKVSIEDGQVKAQITTKNEGDNVIRFTLSPENNLIVIAYYSGLITKFNLLDEAVEREFKSIHSAPITQLKINPSGTLLATGSSDGTVKLWNLNNHYCSHNLKGVNGVITCIEFQESEDEQLLFCSAGDDNIHIFNLESSKRIAKLVSHCSTVTDFQLTPDGSKLISVGRDKIAVVWNILKDHQQFGKTIRTIPIYESVESVVIIDPSIFEGLLKFKLEDDQLFFATLGEEGLIKFWDSKTGSKVVAQNEAPLSTDRNPASPCLQLCSRPEHQQLCAISSERDVFLYNLPDLTLAQQLQGHLDEILSASWFADNNYLALACNTNDLKVMEISTSKSRHLKGHEDIILCVKTLPFDSLCLVTSSKDCTVLVWKFDQSTMTSTIIFKATGHTHAVYSLGLSNSDRTFYSGGEDTTLKRWTFHDSKEIDTSSSTKPLIASQTIKAHEDRIDDIAVSPNDQLVATGSRDKTAKIFSANGLQILGTLKGHRRGVHAVQFSPVDQVIVTAADVSLRMWNLKDFTCVKTFQGHDCAVLNFSFLTTGLQMISMGSDGNMKLWDCKVNVCMKTIDAHSGNTWTLSLTGDNKKIVTGGQDEKLVIWLDTTSEDREEKIANLQTQVVQEQDFFNFINKKKWRKALKMAIAMENSTKTLNVIREILLEPDGLDELDKIISSRSADQLDFIVECCVGWMASARNSATAQQVMNIIIRRLDYDQLMKMPSLKSSMEQLRNLTEKSFNRYERLVQNATFVDFFLNSFKIQ